MTKKPLKNVGTSVRARLLRLARERGEDFQLVLTRYANERLLFRLASSKHAQRFVLKGAALFTVWTGPTPNDPRPGSARLRRSPPVIEVSGPFALFRRTLLYGRALGEVLPFLVRTARFELVARCCLGGEVGELRLRSGDPIFPAAEPKTFDSKLEERFAKDFRLAAPDWDLLREPEPIRAGASFIFPDFLIRHRLDPRREHLFEIVGFWTADYIARKLDCLRMAGINNLILAIDEERRCADGDLPSGARVIWYRKRIDPLKVVDLLR